MALPAVGLGSPYEGLGLLDCGATESLGGWPAADAVKLRSMALYGRDAVCVDTDQHKVFQFGDGNSEPCLSAMRATVCPLGIKSDFSLHVANNEATPVLISNDSLKNMKAIVNFGAGTAIFGALDPNKCVALYQGDEAKHYWIDLFGDHPVVGGAEEILRM